jgi:hypothetical protein
MNRPDPLQSPFSETPGGSGARQGAAPAREPFGSQPTAAQPAANAWGRRPAAPAAESDAQASAASASAAGSASTPAPGAPTQGAATPARASSWGSRSAAAPAAPVASAPSSPAASEISDEDAQAAARSAADRARHAREAIAREAQAPAAAPAPARASSWGNRSASAPASNAAGAQAPSSSSSASAGQPAGGASANARQPAAGQANGRREASPELVRARALPPEDFLKARGAQPDASQSRAWILPGFGAVRITQGFKWEADREDGQKASGNDAIALLMAVDRLGFGAATSKLAQEFSAQIDAALARKEAYAARKAAEGSGGGSGAPRAPRGDGQGPSDEFKELTKKVRNLRSELVMENLGAKRIQVPGDESNVWALPGVGQFTLVGIAWFLAPEEGVVREKLEGRDAIDLTMAALNLRFGQAVNRLSRDFDGKLEDASFMASEEERFALSRAKTDALAEKVRDIEIPLVMDRLGGSPNQDRMRNKWKIDGVGNFSVEGQQWFDFNGEVGGRDAIKLVRHVLNLGYRQAVEWLAEQFGEELEGGDIRASASDTKRKEKKAYRAPERDDSALKYVRQYLHFTRKLPEDLVERLIKRRQLYADSQRSCIFSAEGIAEIRSSFDGPTAVKKLAPGSSRQFGFMVTPDPSPRVEPVIAICESAIDSMSYHCLHPFRTAISSAGAGKDFPRQVALEAAGRGIGVVAAFDGDSAGDKASQALFNFFFLMTWLNKREKVPQEAIIELFEEKKIDIGLATPRPDAAVNEDGLTDEERKEEARLGHLNRLFFNDADPFADPQNPPVIVWRAKQAIGSVPIGEHTLAVNPAAWKFVVERFKLSRERPTVGKDWNETIKTRGTAPLNPADALPLPQEAPAAPTSTEAPGDTPDGRFRGPRM